MLGILFATSKQYSDKLSIDVKRGNDGNIKDGYYNGVTKKGCYVDGKYFIPDEYNWNLLRKAVDMRLYEEKSNTEITKFLKEAKLTELKDKDEPKTSVKVTDQMVGNIFADSFYYGLYKYGNNLTNLIETSSSKPLITADEYILLNSDVAKNFDKITYAIETYNKSLKELNEVLSSGTDFYELTRSKVLDLLSSEYIR